ncbi:patched family domain-containing protein [Ditylenchus destructor]|uniref:Patched family domain-containing protein n=1 Tax=Ditylenchus destructor TaxID=166010 RepID=A0AAD4NHS7_9BILA|nr:patched family domain-containing protein [Ditylenchus destructor]
MKKIFRESNIHPNSVYPAKDTNTGPSTATPYDEQRTVWAPHAAPGIEVDNSGEKVSVASTVGSQTRLIRAVHCVYRRWAYFIVDHAWTVIFICSLISLICTIKVALTPNENDITGYTPYGARSRDELAIRDQFFGNGHSGPSFGAFLLVMPRKPGANLLDVDLMDEIVQVDDIVRNNITMLNHVTNLKESFAQFCRDFCDINQPVRSFNSALQYQTERVRNGEELHDRIELNYPVTTIYGRRLNIQPNFYDITFDNSSSHVLSRKTSNMGRVGMVALIYKAERVGGWSDEEIQAYEMSISNYFEKVYKNDKLRVMSISNTYVTMEVVRAGMSMIPFLAVGFIIMAVCSSCTVLLSAAYMQQISIHKISLALMACVCPFMACGTALGLLFFGGVRFGSILCVTPFLVLAIGVDDAYLMIHAWQRISRQMRRNPVKEDCVAHRLSLVLIDTGPAILISALTNITADAVGSFTGSPEITLLCIGNMASIFVDFLYQVTFYSSVMAITVGHQNEDIAVKKNEDSIGTKALKGLRSPAFHDSVQSTLKQFVASYVKFITNTCVAVGIFLLWLLFIAVSLIGISKFEVNLTSQKLFTRDSPLLEIDHMREQQIVPFYTMATVFVNKPGDLANPERLRRLDSLVHELENLPESWGPLSTNYFMRDFIAYGKENKEEGEIVELEESLNANITDNIRTFLDWPEYQFWRGFVRIHQEKNQTILDSFFFTTAFHGEKLRRWPERSHLLDKWRLIVDSYAEFNTSVYHDEGVFLDLIENMPTDTWQSALATLGCMAAICFIFMYNTFTVLVASSIIASILTGMLGMLSWQGVSMDPIMIAALIISIGFSVDIPAHVAYHYHSAGYENSSLSVRERLKITLASVGFPAIQASLSTSLCVLSLLFVKLYMAQIFVQIMILCLVMCVIHSLILLPALFSLIERIKRIFV